MRTGWVNINDSSNYWESHLPFGGRCRHGERDRAGRRQRADGVVHGAADDRRRVTYDYVIVGGGSAGSALAARLTEDAGTRVLVLEAGRTDSWWDLYIHMPAAFSFPIGNRFYDWKYESEPEPFMNGRRIYHARGKVLGGSSSINGMIFQRGNPLDFERWGLEDWDYAHCLPYFKRMETCLAGADEWRGGDGPLLLERGPAEGPLFGAFLAAAQEAGYELTDDVNGYRQEGFARFDRNIYHGRRWSAARAYLHPAMSRPNLEVRTRTFVERIVFEGTRAIGVQVGGEDDSRRRGDPVRRCDQLAAAAAALRRRQRGRARRARDRRRARPAGRRREPAGPPRGLRAVLVEAARDGGAGVQVVQPAARRSEMAHQQVRARVRRTTSRRVGSSGRTTTVAYPNVMFHFLPIAVRYDGTAPQGHGYQLHVGPMYSDARGSVKITSTDPRVHPALRFNYLSTDQDRREWVECVRAARSILGQPAFEPFNGGELSPGAGVETDDEILDWVRRDAETALHPSCTCAMGTVVDPATMRVYGARRPPRRRRERVPEHHQREHLRAR